MRAVWTFWSKPYDAGRGRGWSQPRHHLQAWGLSLRLARQHFPETVLITDTPGKALLVNKLGLEFTEVSTALDRLRDADPGWWALGKLMAYSLQNQPFVHLDTDVFLWRALPAALISAPVFAQCPEGHSLEHMGCPLRAIEDALRRHGQSLPVEWEWASSRSTTWFRQENCGILGSNRPDFVRHYAQTALRLILDPSYRAVWSELPQKHEFNMILEQFLLGACVDFHRIDPASAFRGISMRYLFSTWAEAYNPASAARVGYTHLIGDAKADPGVTARLDRRVATLDPAFHRVCDRVAAAFL
jgi:hypothetical protein